MTTKAEQYTSPELFDDPPEAEEFYGYELRDNLTEEQIELAHKIADKWKLLRGIMIVTGDVGSGKDLFGNVVSYLIKTLFKGRTVLRDEKPRSLYGYHKPFDETTFTADLRRLDELTEIPKTISRQSKKALKEVKGLTERWMTGSGEVELKNAVLYLTEFWRYMHNRDPFNPMGLLLGGVVKTWRHLDLLLIGTAPKKHELDRFSCLPYITHEVRCEWLGNHTGRYKIIPVKYVGFRGILKQAGRTQVIEINGNVPREILGGKRYYDLFVSKSAVSLQRRKMEQL